MYANCCYFGGQTNISGLKGVSGRNQRKKTKTVTLTGTGTVRTRCVPPVPSARTDVSKDAVPPTTSDTGTEPEDLRSTSTGTVMPRPYRVPVPSLDHDTKNRRLTESLTSTGTVATRPYRVPVPNLEKLQRRNHRSLTSIVRSARPYLATVPHPSR